MDEALIEQVVSAHRDVDPVTGVIRAAPAWHDLTDLERDEAARRTDAQRALEAALDPESLSGTGRAVLARIRRR